MGYITTFSIYNDGASELKKYPEELASILDEACSGIQIRNGHNWALLGDHANLITLQKPRHADDHTLYLHAGNTVTDVYDAKSEWAVDQFILEMTYHLKRLKELKKKLKEDKI